MGGDDVGQRGVVAVGMDDIEPSRALEARQEKQKRAPQGERQRPDETAAAAEGPDPAVADAGVLQTLEAAAEYGDFVVRRQGRSEGCYVLRDSSVSVDVVRNQRNPNVLPPVKNVEPTPPLSNWPLQGRP